MWRGYSSFMLTCKYCVGSFIVFFGDLIFGFLARGDFGEGGGVACFWCLPLRRCRLSACWRRRSGRLAALGVRGHPPAKRVGCLLLPALFL